MTNIEFTASELRVGKVTGIVFAIIHYNRLESLVKTLGSILGQLRSGDCLILIDNGSPDQSRQIAKTRFLAATQNLKKYIRIVYAFTRRNQGGVVAYSWLLKYILSDSIYGATHLLLLGDDDLILPGWRNIIDEHLALNNCIAWGFDFYNWSTKKVERLEPHSGETRYVRGATAHKQWLDTISGIKVHHGRQEHPSALVVPLLSMRKARADLATLIPMPYGDVGLALIIAYADSLVYLDKRLGLIGRGTNYGMGGAERMAANHPTRGKIRGWPSHSKYAAATYVECLLLLNRKDLICQVTKCLIVNHVKLTYCTKVEKNLWSFGLGQLSHGLWARTRFVLEDLIFLIAVICYSVMPWFFDRLILWSLGVTKSFSACSFYQIRNDFVARLDLRS